LGVKAVELLMNGYSGLAVGMKENKIIHKELGYINSEIADKQDKYRLLEKLLG
jgi:6-phosphofructokinase 1